VLGDQSKDSGKVMGDDKAKSKVDKDKDIVSDKSQDDKGKGIVMDKSKVLSIRNGIQQLMPGIKVDDDYDSSGNYKYKSKSKSKSNSDDSSDNDKAKIQDKSKDKKAKNKCIVLDSKCFDCHRILQGSEICNCQDNGKGKGKGKEKKEKIYDIPMTALRVRADHLHEHLDKGLNKLTMEQIAIMVEAFEQLTADPSYYSKDILIGKFIGRLARVRLDIMGDRGDMDDSVNDIMDDKDPSISEQAIDFWTSKDTGSSNDKKPEIFDISTPKEYMPPIIVISLLNTSEGKSRRSKLNMKHELFTAFHWEDSEPHISIEVTGRAQESTGTKPRQRATFYSHYMLWKQVAEGSINTIIAEDDAILVRDIDLTILSDDCITLLGGCIRTPGAWCREMAEFVENMKFLDIVKNFKPGLNNIDYDNFRWTNCLAYYLPVNIARKLVDKVVADKHKVRPVDIWLGQTGFVQQLFFPNMFIDMDEAVTQVNSPKGHQKADFYICEFMRKWAMKQGINLSARGSNTLLAE
jgi:hypothetical protein